MNEKVWLRKALVLASIVLFVGAGVIPSLGGTTAEKTTIMDSKSGSYIQDLIDNASDGDTINIPSGTYYENIIINKSISLIGENKETTIIDGGGIGTGISVSADWVNISGFTIRNGMYYGIRIGSDYNNITGNNISNNEYGINQWISDYNIIRSNIISNNKNGIVAEYSNNNTYIGNIITENNNIGIHLGYDSNTIKNNIISKNKDGIILSGSSKNIIMNNIISKNRRGIILNDLMGDVSRQSEENNIINNNFILNTRHATLHYVLGFFFQNKWSQNYWNRARILPKLIFGYRIFKLPCFNIDWRPAKEPYNIEV